MVESQFDRPAPALTDAEDAETLAAIEEGIAQLDAGRGIPLEELRQQFSKRCSE